MKACRSIGWHINGSQAKSVWLWITLVFASISSKAQGSFAETLDSATSVTSFALLLLLVLLQNLHISVLFAFESRQ